MTRRKYTRLKLLALSCALLALTMLFPWPTVAGQVNSAIANPSFENLSSSAWYVSQAYGNGTVILHDNVNSHNGSYSARLAAVNRTLQCTVSECKDTVRAAAQQNIQSSITLNKIANANNSLSAWWYVAPDPLPMYSLHIGLGFSDGTSIEYWYGRSDVTNQRYNLGPIPANGSWFEMRRDLALDIQGIVANPSTTIVTYVWLAAFGGSFMECPLCSPTPHGETAWVDDVALNFNVTGGTPVSVFSSNPARGTAPLEVRFDATSSSETSGSTGTIIVYKWDFGDGTPVENVSEAVTTHTFSKAGTFTVTLTVVDSNNVASVPSSATIRVDPVDIGIILLLLGGSTGLLAGLLLFRFRRRSSNRRARQMRRRG